MVFISVDYSVQKVCQSATRNFQVPKKLPYMPILCIIFSNLLCLQHWWIQKQNHTSTALIEYLNYFTQIYNALSTKLSTYLSIINNFVRVTHCYYFYQQFIYDASYQVSFETPGTWRIKQRHVLWTANYSAEYKNYDFICWLCSELSKVK